ncbi:MAG: zinc ribbon domain-containing protein [Blastocatellia bacterium]
MNPELSQLLSLQEIDIEIKRLNQELTTLPTRREELERQFETSAGELLALRQEYEDALAEKQRLESSLETEQNKHEKFKADLMKATNEREYTTAVREIDITKKTIGSLETDILKFMDTLEKIEVRAKESSPRLDALRAETDQQIAEITKAVAGHNERMKVLTTARGKSLETLGREARATYERVSKMRSGLALAEARDYTCTGCRMKIRPQIFNELRRADSVITCESCGRILYFRFEATVTS